MKTIKNILLVLFVVLTTSVNAQNWFGGNKKVKGNGNVTTQTRTTSDYSAIATVGSMDVFLVKGTEGSIIVEAESNLQEYIIIETKGDKLIIKTKNGVSLRTKKGIKITVPFDKISSVSLTGSGDVMTKDQIDASEFESNLTGSGDIILDINATTAYAKVTGSGDVTFKGTASELEVKVVGSGDFNSKNLNASKVEVYVSGSGDAVVSSNGTLKVRINGSGDVVYYGNPSLDSKISGSGSVSSN